MNILHAIWEAGLRFRNFHTQFLGVEVTNVHIFFTVLSLLAISPVIFMAHKILKEQKWPRSK